MCRQFDTYYVPVVVPSLIIQTVLVTLCCHDCADAKPLRAPASPHLARLRHCPRSVSLIEASVKGAHLGPDTGPRITAYSTVPPAIAAHQTIFAAHQ